jgi:hypothetical protein
MFLARFLRVRCAEGDFAAMKHEGPIAMLIHVHKR